MKPRNKYERAVDQLKSKLPKLSPARKQWFIKRCHTPQGIYTRSRIYCAECGNWHYSQFKLLEILAPVKCPSCQKELTVKHLQETNYRITKYGMAIDVYKGFQVVRLVNCIKYIKKGKPATFYVREVMQHWIDPNGRQTIFALKCRGLSAYYDEWDFWSDLEIRSGSWKHGQRQKMFTDPEFIYPRRKYIPELKRNGFAGIFYGTCPQLLFSTVLHNPKAETLLKTRQYELLKYLIERDDNNINKYWPSIKICIRNNYFVSNVSDWLDQLRLLEFFGMDTRSPKYVCPEDLQGDHTRLIKRKNRLLLKEKIAKVKEKIEKHEKEYIKSKKKYFGIAFSDGTISVQPLRSVMEFFEEGTEFGHCIFTNEYFAKKDSLLFSAQINGERIETVEVSLKRLEVSQARGLNNKPTIYHDQIVKLVNDNLPVIAKVMARK